MHHRVYLCAALLLTLHVGLRDIAESVFYLAPKIRGNRISQGAPKASKGVGNEEGYSIGSLEECGKLRQRGPAENDFSVFKASQNATRCTAVVIVSGQRSDI